MFRVPFFAEYKRELLVPICERVECKKFAPKESLMEQGDVGNCMYIIYSGEIGIYKFHIKEKEKTFEEVAVIGANSVVGQQAVMDDGNDVRNATVLAQSDVVTLVMTKEDYQSILYQAEVANRMKRLDFLAKLPFFKEWEKVKLSDFNHMANEVKYSAGDTIYDIGQNASTFYLVREGKLTMETIIEVESFFKFPVDRQTWEIRKTTRRI